MHKLLGPGDGAPAGTVPVPLSKSPTLAVTASALQTTGSSLRLPAAGCRLPVNVVLAAAPGLAVPYGTKSLVVERSAPAEVVPAG